jgi:hypothetical protein
MSEYGSSEDYSESDDDDSNKGTGDHEYDEHVDVEDFDEEEGGAESSSLQGEEGGYSTGGLTNADLASAEEPADALLSDDDGEGGEPASRSLDYLNTAEPDVVFAPAKLVAAAKNGKSIMPNEGDAAVVRAISEAWAQGVGDPTYNLRLERVLRTAYGEIGIPTGTAKLPVGERESDLVTGMKAGGSFSLLDVVSADTETDVNVVTTIGPLRNPNGSKALTVYSRMADSAVSADDLIKHDGEAYRHIGLHLPVAGGIKDLTIGLSVATNQLQYKSLVGCVYEGGDRPVVHYVLFLFDRNNLLDLVVQFSRLTNAGAKNGTYSFIRKTEFVWDVQTPKTFRGTGASPHGRKQLRVDREKALEEELAANIKEAEESIPYDESSSFSDQLNRLSLIKTKTDDLQQKYEADLANLRKTNELDDLEEEKSTPEMPLVPARRITTNPTLFVETNANFFTKWARKLAGKAKGKLGFGETARSAISVDMLESGAKLAKLPSDVVDKYKAAAEFFTSNVEDDRRAGALPVTVKYFSVGSANSLVDQRDKKEVAAYLHPDDGATGYSMLEMDLSKGFTLKVGKKQDVIEVALKDVQDKGFAGFEGKFVITPVTFKGNKDINGNAHAIAFLTPNVAALLTLAVDSGKISEMVFVDAKPDAKKRKK